MTNKNSNKSELKNSIYKLENDLLDKISIINDKLNNDYYLKLYDKS